MSNLLPGDLMFTTITGAAGLFVRAGQLFLGDSFRVHEKHGGRSRAPSHVGILVAPDIVLEAMPSGSRVRLINPDRETYFRLPISQIVRSDISDSFCAYLDLPYGWLTYLWLGLHRMHIRPRWLENAVADNQEPICSQLVDDILHDTGYHLFTDGRLPRDVSPGDLWYAATFNGYEVRP